MLSQAGSTQGSTSHQEPSPAPSHRITESQNVRGWKGPLGVTQSNPLPKQGLLLAFNLRQTTSFMPTSAAPAQGCPVSWHMCRQSSWGPGLEIRALLGARVCLALPSASEVTEPGLGALPGGDLLTSRLASAVVAVPPLPAGLSLTTLRTSSPSFPHPLRPARSGSCLRWTPEGCTHGAVPCFWLPVCQIRTGSLFFSTDSSYFCVFISVAASPQVPCGAAQRCARVKAG